ncbi:3'-5' exonuclease [Thermoactinomyces daqus]|uniref:3'-5' exonuclease n=1 Tax=Thermoactinomyces daqus TaxID=1329516 RepID=A0A7W1XA46_9BACL|nr:3'-5' exonuclease [Thermoactinomyces daqus]MBA4542920.1 3'-5' exonuclease [Thermoactinomyces daqus]
MAVGYNTEHQMKQLELRYPMNKTSGVHAALRDIHKLHVEKYQNHACIDFVVDLQRVIRNAGLTKTEKQVIYYFYEKQFEVNEIEVETGLSKGKIHHDLKASLHKISKSYCGEKKEMDYMGTKTYVVYDVETTGLDYKSDQVIEIAAVKLDKRLNEIGKFHTLVALNDGITLSDHIKEITGINEVDLKSGMLEQLALQCLDGFIGDSIVVAHNAQFDLGFLSRYHKHIPVERFICTRSMAILADPEGKASLGNLVERYGIEHGRLHQAMNDVEAEVELFRILKEELRKKGLHEKDYTNLIVASPERPIYYVPNDYTKIISREELKKTS